MQAHLVLARNQPITMIERLGGKTPVPIETGGRRSLRLSGGHFDGLEEDHAGTGGASPVDGHDANDRHGFHAGTTASSNRRHQQASGNGGDAASSRGEKVCGPLSVVRGLRGHSFIAVPPLLPRRGYPIRYRADS